MAMPSVDIPEEQYYAIRRRLVTFFRMSGSHDPESLADEVIFRTVRKIKEGASIDSPLPSYCLGVARNVLREARKKPPLEELSHEPADRPGRGFANLNRVEQMVFLYDCLSPLSATERRLWLEYHLGDRAKLAVVRGQTPNALRIQIHRITNSILRHLNRSPGETR
jgi:hypothetical protein